MKQIITHKVINLYTNLIQDLNKNYEVYKNIKMAHSIKDGILMPIHFEMIDDHVEESLDGV